MAFSSAPSSFDPFSSNLRGKFTAPYTTVSGNWIVSENNRLVVNSVQMARISVVATGSNVGFFARKNDNSTQTSYGCLVGGNDNLQVFVTSPALTNNYKTMLGATPQFKLSLSTWYWLKCEVSQAGSRTNVTATLYADPSNGDPSYSGPIASDTPLSSVTALASDPAGAPTSLQNLPGRSGLVLRGSGPSYAPAGGFIDDYSLTDLGVAIDSFVVYAEKSTALGTGVRTIGGNVGVASVAASGSPPQLSVGGQDHLDTSYRLFAPSVSLGAQAVVGDIESNAVTNGGATVGAVIPYPPNTPRVPLSLASTPSTTNVTVASGQTQTLQPGNYGALVDNGTLNLSPGTYSFSSVSLGNGAKLFAQSSGAADVRVAGTFATGTSAQISASGQAAGNLRISVSGNDAVSGTPAAVTIGAGTQLTGVLVAPRGTVSFADNVTATGAFAGFAIVAGNNVTFTYQSGFLPATQQPSGQQKLSGYITPEIAAAPLIEPVPASTPVWVAISLPVRTPANFPTLDDFARQVSDPTNARYRQYLTPAQYASYYQPSDTDYTTLLTFAQSYGVTVLNSYPDHELVDLNGTAEQVGRLLYANFNYYQRPDGTRFYAIDREPSLATSLPVLQVAGTNSFVVPTPLDAPSGVGGVALTGKDLRSAYISDCDTALDGAGQSIAFIENEGFSIADLTAYSTKAGIPDAHVGEINFLGDVSFIYTWQTDFPAPNRQGEAALDVEVAHAMAPRADIIVYQSSKARVDGLFDSEDLNEDILHSIAHPPAGFPRSNQVSSSWFLSDTKDKRQSINAMAAQGQSFVQASGDNGAYTVNTRDVRSFDNVTVVGGTVVNAFGIGTRPVEIAWTPSGLSTVGSGGGILGGFSAPGLWSWDRHQVPGVPIPVYQAGVANAANKGSTAFRNLPDVAMVANQIDVYNSASGAPGGELAMWGTSASAPMFAGILALANQKAALNGVAPVGFANPVLYAIGRNGPLASVCFNDIADGSFNSAIPGKNGYVSPSDSQAQQGFPAVAGYDLVTGLGSPTCMLVNQLASVTPTTPTPPPPPPPTFAGIGQDDTCAIRAGILECWGLDAHGENGTGVNGIVDTDPHLTPACPMMSTSAQFAAGVAAGSAHTCVIQQSDGNVSCWGDNGYGQLGTGAIDHGTNQPRPMDTAMMIQGLPANDRPVQIAAGGNTTCVVLTSGAVWCWGGNSFGQLGIGSIDQGPHPLPTRVQALAPATQVAIAPGGGIVCALLSSGGVSCWGTRAAVASSSPVTVQMASNQGPLAHATFVSTSDGHACAVVANSGTTPSRDGIWCWGNNTVGELGLGFASQDKFVDAVLATQFPTSSSVACGNFFTCALNTDGTVTCLGDNQYGQIGNGTTADSDHPVLSGFSALIGANAIQVGGGRVCARTSGGISCWGKGPVGNGTTANVNVPTAISFARCF